AMEKVSGSRIATPLAPPSPGSTPMITPRTIPASISTRLNHESATAKPPNNDWISCIAGALRVSEERLEGALWQRDLEPDLEGEEEREHHADAHGRDLEPAVLAEDAHVHRDEDRRGHVDAQAVPGVVDERHVDNRRQHHREDEPQLAPLDEGRARVLAQAQRRVQVHDGRDDDDHADVEREIAGLRP